MKIIKFTIYILVFLGSFWLCHETLAADIYAAQTPAGSDNGSDCANAKAISYYSGSWSGKVAAGDILHLCGTITSTLRIGASGSPGNPITVKFENNSKFAKTAWGIDSNAAIYGNGKSYITIDGNNIGIIENTDNGSPNTTTPAGSFNTQQDSQAICLVLGSNNIIKNLVIQKIYQRVADSDDSNKYGKAIVIAGGNNNIIDNVNISDTYYGIMAYATGANSDAFTVKNSNISRVSTGIVAALNGAYDFTNVLIENLNIFDLYIWDGTWSAGTVWNHNDGIHTWGNYGSGANKIEITVRNSTIGGDFGAHTTGYIYVEDYTTDLNIYNNLIYTTAESPTNGYIAMGTRGTAAAKIYNNTIKGAGITNIGGMGAYFASRDIGNWTADIKNNIITNCYIGISSGAITLTSDYNDFYRLGNVGYLSAWKQTVTAWQIALGGCPNDGNDCHSITSDPKFVSSSDFRLQSDSPVINGGTDLSEYFTTDILGNTRTGVRDIGAYEYVEAVDTTPPASPTGLSIN